MSETAVSLRRKIASAGDLHSVVRTMKALAASSIGQYEAAVRSLDDYSRIVEAGLGVCFRDTGDAPSARGPENHEPGAVGAVVFGSDQGLVGRFNDWVVDFAIEALAARSKTARIWAVGERVEAPLTDAGLRPVRVFSVPTSVKAISPLVGEILVETEGHPREGEVAELHLFFNRPTSGSDYEPIDHRLLPLDDAWRRRLTQVTWPAGSLPEIMGDATVTLRALLREYLFVSLFRACAGSLASENASRLSAMQRADKNIDEMLVDLTAISRRLRQNSIDEELFDVISGFEAGHDLRQSRRLGV